MRTLSYRDQRAVVRVLESLDVKYVPVERLPVHSSRERMKVSLPILRAIEGMLPKNPLGNGMAKKLRRSRSAAPPGRP